MKIKAEVLKQEIHFPIRYAVWCGDTNVAYFSDENRANLIREALDFYLNSKKGKDYLKKKNNSVAKK